MKIYTRPLPPFTEMVSKLAVNLRAELALKLARKHSKSGSQEGRSRFENPARDAGASQLALR